MRSLMLKVVIAVFVACAVSPAIAHEHYRYHDRAGYQYGHAHHSGNWLLYGIGAAVITGAVINASRPQEPPVVYSYPQPTYRYIQVPVYCYPQGVNVPPYVCGYQTQLVPNEE